MLNTAHFQVFSLNVHKVLDKVFHRRKFEIYQTHLQTALVLQRSLV